MSSPIMYGTSKVDNGFKWQVYTLEYGKGTKVLEGGVEKTRAVALNRAKLVKKRLQGEQMKESINEANSKQIIKDLESGELSMDAIVGKHLNRSTSNKDAILKVIRDHQWKKRMRKESINEMTDEQVRKVNQAIAETERYIAKEEKYGDLANHERVDFYRKHLAKLKKMLADRKMSEEVINEISDETHKSYQGRAAQRLSDLSKRIIDKKMRLPSYANKNRWDDDDKEYIKHSQGVDKSEKIVADRKAAAIKKSGDEHRKNNPVKTKAQDDMDLGKEWDKEEDRYRMPKTVRKEDVDPIFENFDASKKRHRMGDYEFQHQQVNDSVVKFSVKNKTTGVETNHEMRKLAGFPPSISYTHKDEGHSQNSKHLEAWKKFADIGPLGHKKYEVKEDVDPILSRAREKLVENINNMQIIDEVTVNHSAYLKEHNHRASGSAYFFISKHEKVDYDAMTEGVDFIARSGNLNDVVLEASQVLDTKYLYVQP